MDDTEIHRHIDELVAEEHKLERAHIGQGLSDAEQARLADLGVQLDRYWDLLRQRDARRDELLALEGGVEDAAARPVPDDVQQTQQVGEEVRQVIRGEDAPALVVADGIGAPHDEGDHRLGDAGLGGDVDDGGAGARERRHGSRAAGNGEAEPQL